MKFVNVTVVRVYLTEGEGQVDNLLKRLHDWEKVRGVTVFRGIQGFGEHGTMHPAGMIDLSMNLPVVIEFFDEPDKVEKILEHMSDQIKPGHVVRWSAEVNA
jgi:PII-like signaling protein